MRKQPRKQPMVRVVSATEAKNRFGEMLKGAYQRSEHLVVERGGIPVAVIVPIQDYEQLIEEGDLPAEKAAELGRESETARARTRLAEFLARVQAQMPDVPADEVEQDIEEAIQAVRRQP